MDEFYKDMMKPLSKLSEKRQCKIKADEMKDNEVKTEYSKQKQTRKAYYSRLQSTYTGHIRKLSEAGGKTFRKNMQHEDPTFRPRINKNSKYLKRSSSTGNTTTDLYNMAEAKKKKKVDLDH